MMLRPIEVDHIYLCTEFVDFRKRTPGLSILVEAVLNQSPFDPHLFVFCNKPKTKIRVLYWEKNGFCLWEKALTEDRFHWPKKLEGPTFEIDERQLNFLIDGYQIDKMKPHRERKYTTVF